MISQILTSLRAQALQVVRKGKLARIIAVLLIFQIVPTISAQANDGSSIEVAIPSNEAFVTFDLGYTDIRLVSTGKITKWVDYVDDLIVSCGIQFTVDDDNPVDVKIENVLGAGQGQAIIPDSICIWSVTENCYVYSSEITIIEDGYTVICNGLKSGTYRIYCRIAIPSSNETYSDDTKYVLIIV